MSLGRLALASIAASTSSATAHADIPPAGTAECSGRAAGEACAVEGQDGQCVDTRCYSARPRCEGPDCPPADGGHDCRLCQPLPPGAARAGSSSGCGCEGGGMGAAGIGFALLVIGLRRRVSR